MSSLIEGNKQPTRVESLDSLRGWAILGVVAIHVSQSAGLSLGLLHTLAINGDMGVELFYVLSAFSLTMVLHARTSVGHYSPIGYFIRRFFRIAPMFWLVLLLATFEYFGKISFWSPNGVGWAEVGLTAIFLHGIHPETINAVIPGGWSVAVEVMFYLTLPVIYKYANTLTKALQWLVLSIIFFYIFGNVSQYLLDQNLTNNALYLSGIYSWYMSFPSQLPVFIMGICAYQVVEKEWLKPIYAYVISGVGGLLLISMPMLSENDMLPRHFLWGAVFAMFVIANVQRPFFTFDNKLLRILGRLSYSTYLLHFFVLTFVGKIFRHSLIQPEIKFALLYFLVVGITYFLSSLSYRMIELPGMKFGGELSRRYEVNQLELKKE